ncbi:MAG: twin-arginine translocase subunit TatC [Prolixibacteraceae bacterium]|nr:twin-arginine translocase subunit TatC [Prolixibacteraceae bacterium]MBN2648506.1 twin-arginine translocase subunit TatC [Prolixibacteraceae bacterium]
MVKRKSKESKAIEMSFMDHLEELRWHIVRAVAGVLIFMIAAFLSRDFIFNEIILKPKSPEFPTNILFANISEWVNRIFNTDTTALAINSHPLNIVNIDMAGQFMSHVKVSLVAGIIVASPYIFFEIWRFIKPALKQNELRYARGSVFYTSLLFITGVLFGYYLIAPLSIHFLSTYNVSDEIANTIKLNSYIGTLTSVTFASGIIFELPVATLFLSRIGLLTPAFMKKYRKHAYVLLLILSAVITPPDVFSQILVCVPLVVLYEISISISRYELRKQDNKTDKSLFKTDKNE